MTPNLKHLKKTAQMSCINTVIAKLKYLYLKKKLYLSHANSLKEEIDQSQKVKSQTGEVNNCK